MKTKIAIVALTIAVASTGLSPARNVFAADLKSDEGAATDNRSAEAMYVNPEAWDNDAPILTAQAGRPGEFSRGGWAMESEHMEQKKAFIADLNLTDAQIEKLAQLKRDFRGKSVSVRAKLYSLKAQRRHMLLQPEINVDEINQIQTQAAAQRKILDGYSTEYLISRAQVLTPEQRHKIELVMDKHELWHHGRHCHHGHHRFHHAD